MSAWPQAVWIVKEIQNQFNLNQRVLYLENRYYIFAPPVSDSDRRPQLPEEYDNIQFSDDSIWFVGRNETNGDRKVYAISLYHTENGTGAWSDFLDLSVDSDQLLFEPEDSTNPIWNNVATIQEALEALATAINASQGAISSGTITIPLEQTWTTDSNGYSCIIIGPNCGINPTISLLNDNNINQKRNFEYIDYVIVNDNDYTEYTFHAIVKPTVALSLMVSAY